MKRSRTERSEASDHLKKETDASQAAFQEQDIGAWKAWNPCPDGKADCSRCYIDYATYLATKAALDASTEGLGGPIHNTVGHDIVFPYRSFSQCHGEPRYYNSS